MATALITGVSRRSSIGFAVARRLLDRGDRVVVQSWAPHDAEQPWAAADVDGELAAVLAELGDPPHVAVDLADPTAPARLVDEAVADVGPLTTSSPPTPAARRAGSPTSRPPRSTCASRSTPAAACC